MLQGVGTCTLRSPGGLGDIRQYAALGHANWITPHEECFCVIVSSNIATVYDIHSPMQLVNFWITRENHRSRNHYTKSIIRTVRQIHPSGICSLIFATKNENILSELKFYLKLGLPSFLLLVSGFLDSEWENSWASIGHTGHVPGVETKLGHCWPLLT